MLRRIAPLILAALFFMGAVSHNDKYQLSQDSGFKNRVRVSLIAACIAIANEGWNAVFHEQRMRQAQRILNAPDSYVPLFANSVATDTSVINDATATGTVALTTGNVATQAALVTDAHIDNAISAQFNSFLVPLQNG